MSILAQLTANSLITGSIYALVAVGFSLIFVTNKFMHFAHGVSVAIASYLLYSLFSLLEVPFFIAVSITILLTGILGVLMYRIVYLPLQNKKSSNVILLIASIALLILFENILQMLFGAGVKSINYISTRKGLDILGATITPLQIFIILVSVVLMILLYFFMNKTKLGRDMRAVADNKELANIIGINSVRISEYSFFIGSALAGVAGILIGLEQNLSPLMGTILMVKGFTGAIVGGITSVPGAILGSLLLGFAENYGIWFLPQEWNLTKEAIGFTLLFLFLLIKPTGIFGINKGVKK
jgi:branched-chain amino acid transport system permease protein